MSALVGYGGFFAWLEGLLDQWKADKLSDAAAELFLNILHSSAVFKYYCHFSY